MEIKLPDKVRVILDTLEEAGFEAYVVGGCVRDSILSRIPGDWDITTSASPVQVKRLFGRTVDTGIEHGTVTVLYGSEGFEVTTYRIDGVYEDNRHPREVIFTRELLEDLRRRDFTVNAMAYNPGAGLVDAFGGIEDLKRGIIRCVGDPVKRFQEDALRMMRAVRFAAQLGYEIEEETRKAISSLCANLEKISAERIQTELIKLLISPNPRRLKDAWELGITGVVLPEFDRLMETPQPNPHHCLSVGEHTLKSLEKCPAERIYRLVMLLHDIGKPDTARRDRDGICHFHGHANLGARTAEEILKRLKFDNDTTGKVSRLVRWHDYRPEATGSGVRKAVHKVGEDIFPMLFPVKRADILAQSEYRRQEKLKYVEELERLYGLIAVRNQCVSLKDLAVSGKDLIDAGMKPGKELGQELERLLQIVLEDPDKNKRDLLLAQIQKI